MDASAAAQILRVTGQVQDPRRHNRLHPLTANLLQRSPKKRSIRCKRKCCGWSKAFLVQTLFGGLSNQP